MEAYKPFSLMGWLLVIMGILFIIFPYIIKLIPSIEKLPWFIVFIYKRDGFYFVTSPILIFLSIISILISFWNTK
jgi:hypothetical protein